MTSALAGPEEEVVVVAVPTALLRRPGWSWPAVAAATLLLRVAFHLYYGWGTVGIAVWALIVWAWHARSGCLVGPMIAHSAVDLTGSGANAGTAGQIVVSLCLPLAAVVLLVAVVRAARRSRTRTPVGYGGPLPPRPRCLVGTVRFLGLWPAAGASGLPPARA